MMDGEIVVWYIAEGDMFKEGQAILEVETDKATIPYNATEEGYLAKILIPSGKSKVRSSSRSPVLQKAAPFVIYKCTPLREMEHKNTL
jgi:pyruvate dehydrogenase E2 component (dihydrolipoamide acetyltransferase)